MSVLLQPPSLSSARDLEAISALISMRSQHPITDVRDIPCSTHSIIEHSNMPTPQLHSQLKVPAQLIQHTSVHIPAILPHPQPFILPSLAPPTIGQALPYTPAQRQDALRRYKEKKQRRKNRPNAIRYQVRKRLADTRPRHRGRFFKPKSNSEESLSEVTE